jgi:hypothetical protein
MNLLDHPNRMKQETAVGVASRAELAVNDFDLNGKRIEKSV